MGYFVVSYFLGLGALAVYDSSLLIWAVIGSWIIAIIIGMITFCESWWDVILLPLGLLLCACSTII